MAYAAVIFLNHNIQRLLGCTVNLGITPKERRGKIKALHRFQVTQNAESMELKALENAMEKNDVDGSKIRVATKSLANILGRLDGSRNRGINRSSIDTVDAEIRDAVWELEDVLHTYASDGDGDGTLPPSQGRIRRHTKSFLRAVKILGEKYTRALCGELLPGEGEEDSFVFVVDVCRSLTVGAPDQLERIVNELTDLRPRRFKTVSIVGMAGIGKTHLARGICRHPLVARRFDLLVWVRVGPRQQLKNVWADVVAQVEGKPKDMYMETNIITLVGLLEKSLSSGRRYLIVLDDIWSSEVCYGLIKLLRSDRNGTRVLVTTRLEDVAKYFDSSIHQRLFLTNEESWELLRRNVFDEDDKYPFPPHLEEAGRKIAEKCEGLPLLILTVADILCGLDKTQEYWNKVADEKTTTFTDAYDKIAKVLFSSYDYLPQYLKPCFLYMGVFPKRCKIASSKLIYLLTAEDFMDTERCLVRIMKTPRTPRAQPKQLLPPTMFLSPPRVPAKPKPQLPPTMSSSPPREPRLELGQWPWSLNRVLPSICRVTRSFETLYLLEPGPSPTRFITPLRKMESLRRKFSRTMILDPLEHPLEPIMSKHLVEDSIATAENLIVESLERLVANSLVIVCKKSSKSRIKSCKLHSAYWYLCVKEAKRTKFFHVLNKLRDASKDCIQGQRRLSVQNSILFGIKEVYNSVSEASTVRSLLFTGEDHGYPVPICSNLVRLRVLEALAIRFYDFPTEVLKLLHLRYLSLTHNGEVPSSISKLTQLQFFAVRRHHNIKLRRYRNRLPGDIWDMEQLTHLWIMGSYLPSPGPDARLPSLYTLHIDACSCREDVFRGVPYLKKLAIRIELHPVDAAETQICCLEHITLLDQLESLKCIVFNPRLEPRALAPTSPLLDLPAGIKKLSLNGLVYPWEYMSVIGSLPNLQVLKLRVNAFRGEKWEPESGEFMRLEFLLLEDVDLVHWTIHDDEDEDEYFPNLRRLIIRHCYKLKKIPLDISTLETLEVVDCSPAIVKQVHQDTDCSSSVQLVIKSSWKV